jgi:hypothetical protein
VILFVGVLQFIAFSLVARYSYTSVTFDPVVWASQQCHVEGPDGWVVTSEQARCFDAHEANASTELWAPTHALGRRLVRWSLLPLLLGFGLLMTPVLSARGPGLLKALRARALLQGAAEGDC